MHSQVGSLVRVWTDVGARKPVALLAKIIEKDGVIFTIRYLTESDDHIWRYETDTYDIDDDSIAEYLRTDKEDEIGFIVHDDGFLKVESDEDYVPSDEDSDDESDSFEESDEEDDKENEEFEESDAESEESIGEE